MSGRSRPSPRQVADDLALDPARWTVRRAESPTREATGPDGAVATVTDHVLEIRRRGRTRGAAPRPTQEHP